MPSEWLEPSPSPPTTRAEPPASPSRRVLIGAGGTLGVGVGLVLLGTTGRAVAEPAAAKKATKKEEAKEGEEDIGPGEDLMREHGVLRRVLLIYREAGRRLEGSADGDAGAAIRSGAALVRRFVEDYHERQEEEFVFPRFERAHRLVELVRILRAQHQAGRKVTEGIVTLAHAASLQDAEKRRQLRGELAAFVRMYEPHASREDTVLFPALHDIVSANEYDALGEEFEKREHQIFGGDGFERAVSEVEAIEKTLGIEDLARFTPKV